MSKTFLFKSFYAFHFQIKDLAYGIKSYHLLLERKVVKKLEVETLEILNYVLIF